MGEINFSGADGALTAWPLGGSTHPMKWAEININSLQYNVVEIRKFVGSKVAVMAMVKANGYGHGAVLSARAFLKGGASWLGVSSPEEALQLREAGIQAPILNVNWTHPASYEPMIKGQIDMAISDLQSLQALIASARKHMTKARVHIKIDTGMHRLGFDISQIKSVLQIIGQTEDALEVVGIFTHFADADGENLQFTKAQHQLFLEVLTRVKAVVPQALVHAANSAATLRLVDTHHDIVRPGLALYGYAPDHCAGIVDLQLAMNIKAYVTHVKYVEPGERVGYGCTWQAKRRTKAAVIAAGYADGLNRLQANGGAVLIHGTRCPLIGRVSMDQISVDVTELPEVGLGDESVILGSQGEATISADEIASVTGTISYEVLCAVSARVPRVIVE